MNVCCTWKLGIMPEESLEGIPTLRVTVEIGHAVKHARLNRFSPVFKQPHDGAPRKGGKEGEPARIGRDGFGDAWGGRARGLAAREEGGNDTRADVQNDGESR